jgi:hypothetical protein
VAFVLTLDERQVWSLERFRQKLHNLGVTTGYAPFLAIANRAWLPLEAATPVQEPSGRSRGGWMRPHPWSGVLCMLVRKYINPNGVFSPFPEVRIRRKERISNN